jgi:hypothetical protein
MTPRALHRAAVNFALGFPEFAAHPQLKKLPGAPSMRIDNQYGFKFFSRHRNSAVIPALHPFPERCDLPAAASG